MAANAAPKVAPEKLVGTFRRFGETGPVYEIVAIERDDVKVEVPETGEKLTVALRDVLADPSAE
jgi:hypothetical protein